MSLTDFHTLLGNAFSLFVLLVTLWALLQYLRNQPLGSDFWGAVVVGEVLMVVQGALGAILYFSAQTPARPVHFLYGILSLLIWPATFSLARGQSGRRETLIWLLVSAFLFGITLRARVTGLP